MTERLSLVVGLGNPGPRYASNRHNLGALVLEQLASRASSVFKTHKAGAQIAECRLGMSGGVPGPRVVLAKPSSYMNLSGGPVAALARFFRTPADDIIVVHDELDVPFGVIRLKQGGGDGGHNGLKSVTSALGSSNYLRVRVGIGRPARQDPADYVLSGFSSVERVELDAVITRAADAVEALLVHDLVTVQNEFH